MCQISQQNFEIEIKEAMYKIQNMTCAFTNTLKVVIIWTIRKLVKELSICNLFVGSIRLASALSQLLISTATKMLVRLYHFYTLKLSPPQ